MITFKNMVLNRVKLRFDGLISLIKDFRRCKESGFNLALIILKFIYYRLIYNKHLIIHQKATL